MTEGKIKKKCCMSFKLYNNSNLKQSYVFSWNKQAITETYIISINVKGNKSNSNFEWQNSFPCDKYVINIYGRRKLK